MHGRAFDASPRGIIGGAMTSARDAHARGLRWLVAAVIAATVATVAPTTGGAQQDVFSDVTDGVQKPAIDVLGEMGLFEGTLCGEDMFCPGDEIKRSAINDGSQPQDEITPPEEPDPTTGSRIPEPDGRSAKGRCDPAIVMGIYDWEDCAWGISPDPEMRRSEGPALMAKVWAETKARGKPDEPPNLTEGYCGEQLLGCYLASTHTIQLSLGFTLRTLLHELAHALISDNESAQACDDDWTHRQPQCLHGDLYRCAADALYVRYGGIKSAGVCGQAPSLDPGDWHLWQPDEVEWGIIHAAASVLDENAQYSLGVRCETNFETGAAQHLAVLLNLPRAISGDTLRVRYLFSDEQHLSDSWWDAAIESRQTVFWSTDAGAFLARFSGADQLYMQIEYGERDVARPTFDLGDSPATAIVKSACS